MAGPVVRAVKSRFSYPKTPRTEAPHVDSLPLSLSLSVSSGCVWRRLTGAFERFGLFSGQVFTRPLRNQPAHCPARTIQLRRRNPDARRNPGVIVRRAHGLSDRHVFAGIFGNSIRMPARPRNTVCDDSDYIEPRVKWRTMVTVAVTWHLLNCCGQTKLCRDRIK